MCYKCLCILYLTFTKYIEIAVFDLKFFKREFRISFNVGRPISSMAACIYFFCINIMYIECSLIDRTGIPL